LIGALTGFHPFIISVWGTDVMKFPQKNIINRKLLKYNFKKADVICATSNTIKSYVSQVIDKPVEVIPFGVDLNIFKPKQVKSLFAPTDFVVGTIKPLENIYNIHILVEAFTKLSKKHDNMKLLIIGEGREKEHLMKMCAQNEINDKVIFPGRINFAEISNYFNMLDVLVNISDYESFGVSVIEAMACEKPVVVTDVGGLKEVVETSEYGALVKIADVDATMAAIERFYFDKELKIQTGKNCRRKVNQKYNWENNVEQMIKVYQDLLKK
jgi:glycosyltransferase involved in cell wall biosynthesis